MTRGPQRGLIKRASLDEVAALSALHRKAFLTGEAWTETAFETLLELPTTRAYAYRSAGACLGVLVVQFVADQAEILTLATDPSVRRQGLGRQLLDHAVADAASGAVFGAIKSWWLDVAADNHGALAFYDKLGFQIDGRRPQYYKRLEGPRVDAILMSKQVGGQPAS